MLTVVKIGGNALDDAALLAVVVDALAAMTGEVIVVHGGGVETERLANRLGVEQTVVDGRRVTDAATLDIAVMVYAGLLSKRLVAALQARGRNAIGLSGADGNVLRATMRPAGAIAYGFVGDVDAGGVDTRFLGALLDNGVMPVLCAITHDGQGTLLNSNADGIASVVAQAFAADRDVRMLYCFDRPGVLRDAADPDGVLHVLSYAAYQDMRDAGLVTRGMLPKLDAGFAALRAGAASVRLMDAARLADVAEGMHTGGTDLVL